MRSRASIRFAVLALAAVSACDGAEDRPPHGELPDGSPSDCLDCSPVVTTTSGPVRAVEAGATWAFLGIPYAAPPVDGSGCQNRNADPQAGRRCR
jgi:hypothetical protein